MMAHTDYHSGRIWHDDKIVVPARRVPEVLAAHHDLLHSGHWGVAKTTSMLRRRFVFPQLNRAVKDFVASCPICQKVKADHHLPRGYLQALLLPVTKWESVAMDWVVGLPPTIRFGTRFDSMLLVPRKCVTSSPPTRQ